MEEIWRDIVYNTNYEISNLGRVRNKSTQHILKHDVINSGYARIKIPKAKNDGSQLVHRMVASAFVDNPENKPHVNHIDANRLNNRVDNLEWVTPTENIADVIARGKLDTHSARKALVLEKKVIQLDKDTEEEIKTWDSIKEAAEALGIQRSKISLVCSGDRKTTGGFKWKHANPEGAKSFKTLKVKRTDEEGNVVLFSSISKASKALGVNRTTLAKHMNKETVDGKITYAGYIWEKY